MHLDGGVRGFDGHFLFHDHAVLNVLAAGVDLLTGDKTVELGILAQTPDIGGQQHMGQTKVGQTFFALLTNVTLHMGDLKGLVKQIGAGIALYLEVGGDLGHGSQGTDTTAVYPVAPGGMIFITGVDTDGEYRSDQTQCHQCVGQNGQQGFIGAQCDGSLVQEQ